MIDDLELIYKAKSDDVESESILMDKYKSMVLSIARKYYLIGGDNEDLEQEGWVGFFEAVRSFDETKNGSFKAYSGLIVERQIISAIRRANANKNQVLSSSVFIDDDDVLPSEFTPELDVISEENYNELSQEIQKNLSDYEKQVVGYYLDGYTYIDIARMMRKDPKSIDNALFRIKNKLKYLKERL